MRHVYGFMYSYIIIIIVPVHSYDYYKQCDVIQLYNLTNQYK